MCYFKCLAVSDGIVIRAELTFTVKKFQQGAWFCNTTRIANNKGNFKIFDIQLYLGNEIEFKVDH